MTRRRFVVCLLACLLVPAAAGAQSTTLSDQDKKAILDYPLTLPRANSLIAAMQEMTAYMVSHPDFSTVIARSMKMTRTEQIAQLAKDPMALAIVTKHGLKPADYTYGVPALRMALNAAQGLSGPTTIPIASPANIAFAKANLAELKPKMDAADGGGRR